MKTDKTNYDNWEPTISYADVAARFPSHAWEVVDKKGNEYRIERVAPTVDDTLVIWVVPIETLSEDASEGPWVLDCRVDGTWFVWKPSVDVNHARETVDFRGAPKEQALLFRDALNRLKEDE